MTEYRKSSFLQGVSAAATLIVLLAGNFSLAADRGKANNIAFSDPAATQEMPDEWKSKPIVYEKNDGAADLVVGLNQQFYDLIEPIVRDFSSQRGINISIIRGTCGLSAGMLQKKTADIGSFCCPPASSDRLPGLTFHTLGIHPIAVLVHPENPIHSLSFEKIRQIFQGDYHRWSEVGGENIPIQVITRLHCKARPGHWRLLLANEDLFSPQARNVGAIKDMFSLVSGNQGAVGYEVWWLSSEEGSGLKTLKINGDEPGDLDSLLGGDYPLHRSIYLTLWEGDHVANGHARSLVDYLTEYTENHYKELRIVPASILKDNGWKFKGNELIGEP